MSYSITTQAVPQAPVQVSTPLPPPKNPSVNAREYSEGSMYDELNPEDLKAPHDRYAAYRQWRHEIPTKKVNLFGHTNACSSTQSFGLQVGVGSANWNWQGGDQTSDTGTVPTTIVGRQKEQKDRELEIKAQALMTSVIPPQSNIPNARTKPSRAPSVPTQPASAVKSAFTLSRRPSVRQPIQPILAQPIPQPSQVKQIPTSSRYPFPTQPSKKPFPSPGTLLVPSPTHSATHAEREAYFASVTDLPLKMLIETQDGASASKKINTHVSTSRSDRDRARGKIASNMSASSNTSLPSIEQKSKRARSLGSGGSSKISLGRRVTDVVKAESSSGVRRKSRPVSLEFLVIE